MNQHPYLRLLRFDKPAGLFLLWFPVLWGLWFASQGMPSLKLLFIFSCGTALMRSAGCIINDIADRAFDKHVERTANRPITRGDISVYSALLVLGGLLILALSLLIFLPIACTFYALVALLFTAIYPYCKRFIYFPQAVLGIAFSLAILMAFAAVGRPFDANFLLLFLLNLFWVLAYDTIYAMADKNDDLLIGVKSTAIYFADYDRHIIGLLQVVFHGLWLLLAAMNHFSVSFYFLWSAAGLTLIYQQVLIHQRQPQRCFQAFVNNVYYGFFMFLALLSGFN